MTTIDELQERVLELSPADRGGTALAVLNSLEFPPSESELEDDLVREVLDRSTAYSRGELKAVEWRAALQDVRDHLSERPRA